MTGFEYETPPQVGSVTTAPGAPEALAAKLTLELAGGWTLTLTGGLDDLPDLIARLQAAERLLEEK